MDALLGVHHGYCCLPGEKGDSCRIIKTTRILKLLVLTLLWFSHTSFENTQYSAQLYKIHFGWQSLRGFKGRGGF